MLTALLVHCVGPGLWPAESEVLSARCTTPNCGDATGCSRYRQLTPAVEPADVEPVAAVEELEATEAEQQSSRKTAKNDTAKTAATTTKVGEGKQDAPKVEKFASYYAQNETPPPAPGLLQDGPPNSPSDQGTPFRDEARCRPCQEAPR